MEPRVLKALTDSIKHHEDNANAARWSDVHLGTGSCSLCGLFHSNRNDGVPARDCCKGCPVYERVGMGGCLNTPYIDASKIYREDYTRDAPPSLAFVGAELEEVKFLRSLLPPFPDGSKLDEGELHIGLVSGLGSLRK
jgi:hypothetical protein